MRRLSKAKKGRGATNENREEKVDESQDTEPQDNGKLAASDDESLGEKRGSVNQSKKNRRGRKGDTSKSKKSKKGRKSHANEDEGDEDEIQGQQDEELHSKNSGEEFEVMKVVDCRMVGDAKQYKIRWKGYGEDQDTWESEADLECQELIEEFLAQNPDAVKKEEGVEKAPKSNGKRKGKKTTNVTPMKVKKQRVVEPVTEEDGEKVYEVEKVVEVHFKKNGQREFLIRWKGFSSEDDTWEPENNLNCKDLIDKFMEKVDKAKQLTMRELRVNPQATNRFTLSTRDTGRRLSSRHTSKQRVTYYNTE